MAMLDKELVQDILLKNTRSDGRNFDEYRKITLEKDYIEKAQGSARVEMGDTTVIAGIKIEPGTPFEDRPNEGILVVNAEFVPLASHDFEPGPPGENAIELARVVDRMIRESKMIDTQKLVISEGNVWKVMVDIIIINHDGNLIDASALACTAALCSAKMPKFSVSGEKFSVDYEAKRTEPLPVSRKPVSVTVSKIADKFLVDLTATEETARDSRLTVGMFDESGKIFPCSMQKGGSKGFTEEDFHTMLDIAERKGRELIELV